MLKKTISDATKQRLFDTRHLSIAESAGICKRTQDFVRQWRKKHGYQQKRDRAIRYTLNVGESVMYHDKKTGEERVGRIIAKEEHRYLVRFDDGSECWHGENHLAAMPSLEEIAETAYKIKMRNIEAMAAK